MQTRWSEAQINAWYHQRPWLVGMNYLPASAVNWNELWQAQTFDLPTIKRELSWAQQVYQMNTLRINLPFIVWLYDRDGLMARIDAFLQAATDHGISTMLTLMDDCGFSGDHPWIGRQKEPRPGVHNSQGAASPGRNIVVLPDLWGHVERYIKDVVTTFKDDERVLVWDVYNEPTNDGIFLEGGIEGHFDGPLLQRAYELCERAIAWVRSCDPSQPITIGAWRNMKTFIKRDVKLFASPIDQLCLEHSDIISFHAYAPKDVIEESIALLKQYQRPLLCTEWLARHAQSTVEDILPIFERERVGCYNWGLVNGRTQTHLPWPVVMQNSPDYAQTWFHDLFHQDGTPYSQQEVELFVALRARSEQRTQPDVRERQGA